MTEIIAVVVGFGLGYFWKAKVAPWLRDWINKP